MKKIFKIYLFILVLFSSSSSTVWAQCNYIPSTSTSIDTLSYTFSGGSFASYGCAPIDPTFWLSGNGIYVIATFVNPESYPSFRVWGMNDDDSASVEVNGISYPLNLASAAYDAKVICGISPGPDGVIFSNGKVAGANSNAMGNYSYQNITINATNVLTLKVTGTSGAGWGFAGITVDCIQLPVAAIAINPVSICPGTCIGFANLSMNATQYEWFFPGANPPGDTAFNPSGICYFAPGSYDVTLIATNSSGSDTLTLNNYITVYPYPAPQGIAQNGDTLFANAGAVSYQWYHNGLPISGATDYFYVANEGGDYNIVATDANGCEVEAAIFDIIASLTPTHSTDKSVTVYPNPVVDKFSIQNLPGANEEAPGISIYNALGEKVYPAVDCKKGTVDCRLLPSGMYLLEINSAASTFHTRFVKQ